MERERQFDGSGYNDLNLPSEFLPATSKWRLSAERRVSHMVTVRQISLEAGMKPNNSA
jgi:hypothetical protein